MFTSNKSNLKKADRGFTIIEVMIVLAIAGLILLIVFLAVPALQRNSRNTQRKDDSSHLASLISEWESNNAGQTPTAFGTGGGTAIDITGEHWAIITAPTTITAATSSTDFGTPPAADSIQVNSHTTCTGNKPQYAASSRSVTVWYGLEGNTKSGCIES
jgi:prepilin-type N-terminal cleavage/methylation domain-containing protein